MKNAMKNSARAIWVTEHSAHTLDYHRSWEYTVDGTYTSDEVFFSV